VIPSRAAHSGLEARARHIVVLRMHPTRNTYRRTLGGDREKPTRGGRGSLRRRCFLIVYPICPRKQGQSAGKTRPLTRTIPGPRDRACQRCIIGFLYAHVKCSSRTPAHNVTGRGREGAAPPCRPLWLPTRVPGPEASRKRSPSPLVTRIDRNRLAGSMIIARETLMRISIAPMGAITRVAARNVRLASCALYDDELCRSDQLRKFRPAL